jgi:hypothetical protein
LERQIIETHLGTCEECRKEKDAHLRIWSLLDEYRTPELNADFLLSLKERMKNPENQHKASSERSRIIWWRNMAAAAAGLIIVAYATYLVFDMGKESPHGDAIVLGDEELFQNLEIYENIEILQNFELLANYEIIERMADEEMEAEL